VGFYAIGFSRVVPCGEGKALLESLLSPHEIRSAYEKIISLDSPGFRVRSGDPLAGLSLQPEPPSGCDITLSGCSAGFSGVTVISDGSVMPCRRIGLAAGNLKKESLRTIWASSEILWQLRRKESYQGKCGRCVFWPSCRGCRAVSYAYSVAQGRPNLFADDPQCWVSGAEGSCHSIFD
jgi:radical SAM protein with 4Fe4S-binding SPASM domain